MNTGFIGIAVARALLEFKMNCIVWNSAIEHAEHDDKQHFFASTLGTSRTRSANIPI